MNKQKGLSAVAGVLAVIILGILGFVGWYVWHANYAAPAKMSGTNNTPVAIDQYDGWKSASLKYEKISYKYPANWTLTDLSVDSPKGSGCVYPGNDYILLTSPSDKQIIFHTGVACIGDGESTSFDTIPLTALGENLYLALENNVIGGQAAPSTPLYACLAQTKTPKTYLDFASKHISFDGSGTQPVNSFCYYPFNWLQTTRANTSFPSESVSSIKNSKDFATAKLVFESLRYKQ